MSRPFPDIDPDNAEPLVRGGQGRTACSLIDSAMVTGLSLFVVCGLVWFAVMFWRSL